MLGRRSLVGPTHHIEGRPLDALKHRPGLVGFLERKTEGLLERVETKGVVLDASHSRRRGRRRSGRCLFAPELGEGVALPHIPFRWQNAQLIEAHALLVQGEDEQLLTGIELGAHHRIIEVHPEHDAILMLVGTGAQALVFRHIHAVGMGKHQLGSRGVVAPGALHSRAVALLDLLDAHHLGGLGAERPQELPGKRRETFHAAP